LDRTSDFCGIVFLLDGPLRIREKALNACLIFTDALFLAASEMRIRTKRYAGDKVRIWYR
jgi:hypothetical protein